MGRTVILIGKTESGSYVDAVSGKRLECVVDGNDIEKLLKHRMKLRDNPVVGSGAKEVKLSQVLTMSTATAGGLLKSTLKFK